MPKRENVSLIATAVRHNAKPYVRRLIAATLSVIYLLIACGPLATAVVHANKAVFAFARECSGDCSICGCSPESRAAHTCCCSQKRQQQAQEEATPDCCKKKPVSKRTFIASCGCPCGDDDAVALSDLSCYDVLPYYFTGHSAIFQAELRLTNHPAHLYSRFTDPPKPPPRQA